MSSKQLCRKCHLMLSGQLIHFSADELSGSRELQHTHIWLFENTQDADTEVEQSLRPRIEAAELARLFLQHVRPSSLRTANKDYSRGIPEGAHLGRSVLFHHSWPLLEKSTDSCHLCFILRSAIFQKVSHQVRWSMLEEDTASPYSSPSVPILVIDGLRSPDLSTSSRSRWLPYPDHSSRWRQSIKLYLIWLLDGPDIFEINRDLYPYAYGWEDEIRNPPLREDPIFRRKLAWMDEQKYPQDRTPPEASRPTNINPEQSSAQTTTCTLPELTRTRLLRWIDSCDKHVSCRRRVGYVPSWHTGLPKRLIELRGVNEELTIRIVESQVLPKSGNKIKYATLSHCWGLQGPPVRLLQSNMAEFSKDIPLGNLPRTFREAVDVAQALNINYLWIDAMCIVQDLESDWQIEAPRMVTIYSGGVVNLAATNAQDDCSGLLTQDPDKSDSTVRASWTGSWLPPTLFAIVNHFAELSRHIGASPLNSRAWVFQERLLSPRTIHFCADQIRWECREITDQERLPLLGPLTLSMNPYHNITAGLWIHIVHMYNRTRLTFAADRLVAFAGVAQVFAAYHRCESKDYAAGLWAKSIKPHLLWQAIHHAGRIQRSTEYIAPSWSWASNDSDISFWTASSPPDEQTNTVWRAGFDVLAISIYLKTASEFGQVTGGHLLVRASLRRVRFSMQKGNQWEEESQDRVLKGYRKPFLTVYALGSTEPQDLDTDIRNAAHFVHDKIRWMHTVEETSAPGSSASSVHEVETDHGPISERTDDTPQTYFMPMAMDIDKTDRFSPGGLIYYRGLVLERLDGRGLYKRIGYLRFTYRYREAVSPSWWDLGDELDSVEYLERFPHRMYKIKIV